MQQQGISRRAILAIGATAGLSFIGILVETSLNVSFPTMVKEFGVPLSTLQWLTTGYLLGVTLMMSASGHLLAKLSPKTLFIVAEVTCIAGTLLCAVATNFPVILIGRILQSAATGLATPLMFHIIFAQVPLQRLGVYVGVANMVTSLAPALGPAYGGMLTSAMSWRGIFWLTLVPIVAILPLGVLSIHMRASRTKSRFDAVGFALLGAVMLGLIEVLTLVGEHKVHSWSFVAVAAIGALALGLLAWHVAKGKRQILNFRLLLRGTIGARALNYFILQFANIGVSYVIPILSQDFLHVDAMTAGLMLLPGSLIGALAAPIAGGFYDREGPRRVLIAADAAMLVGMVLLGCFTFSLTPLITTGLYIFLRLGFNIGFGSSMSDAVKQVESAHNDEINALFNTVQQYAGSLGTGALAAVITFSQLAPGADTARAVGTGSRIDFLFLAVLCLIALAATLASTRRPTKSKSAGAELG